MLAGGVRCVPDEPVRHRQRRKDADTQTAWTQGQHADSGICGAFRTCKWDPRRWNAESVIGSSGCHRSMVGDQKTRAANVRSNAESERWNANRTLGLRAVPWSPDGSDNAFDIQVGMERPAEMEDIDSVPSNVQSARQEALLYVFEDNEAVIKMIIKGKSPTMRHVSRTHRVALDWLFDRINLDSKIQIKYIDTKNQLADILTKGSFTCDEWNHLLSLFNISHFSFTVCSAAMAKRIQQESGEERVTAKSRPMMNLTARMPTVVSSSTSSSPVKTWYEYQDPGKSVVVDDRSGKPDKTSWNAVQQICHHGNALLDGNAHSVRYGEIIHDGSGQPDSANYQEEADSETFVMGSDAAEFVNKVKDQVRKRQKRMSNVADSGEEHSIIWGMFMAATMNAATFMGKNFMDNENAIKNSTDLTLKKMFEISEKLVSEQEEINNVDKIYWKIIHGNSFH